MTFILGFWIGFAVGLGGMWLYLRPADRAVLVARIKALFAKKGAP